MKMALAAVLIGVIVAGCGPSQSFDSVATQYKNSSNNQKSSFKRRLNIRGFMRSALKRRPNSRGFMMSRRNARTN